MNKIQNLRIIGPGVNYNGFVGIQFTSPEEQTGNFFNSVTGCSIEKFETLIKLEPTANANHIIDPQLSHYKTAIEIGSVENSVIGGFCHASKGKETEIRNTIIGRIG